MSGTMQPDPTGRYQGIVYAPSTFGLINIRFLIRNSESDIDTMRQIQKEFSGNAVKRSGEPTRPILTANISRNSSSSQLDYIIKLTARFAPTVSNTQNDSMIPTITTAALRAAGISIENGTYKKPSCVNMTKAGMGFEAALVAIQTPNKTELTLATIGR